MTNEERALFGKRCRHCGDEYEHHDVKRGPRQKAVAQPACSWLCSGFELRPEDVPNRRNRSDLFTTAERAIAEAMQFVEAAGADPRLTHAVVLLQMAREYVADYVDRVDSPRRSFAAAGHNGVGAMSFGDPAERDAHETEALSLFRIVMHHTLHDDLPEGVSLDEFEQRVEGWLREEQRRKVSAALAPFEGRPLDVVARREVADTITAALNSVAPIEKLGRAG
jgi:hypothetical protein